MKKWNEIAKLLPRLASDHAGEVAATAAAISRKLIAGGSDWHELAKRVASGGQGVASSHRPAAKPHDWGMTTRAPNGNIRTEGAIKKYSEKAKLIEFDDFGEMWVPNICIVGMRRIFDNKFSFEIKQSFAREKRMCE